MRQQLNIESSVLKLVKLSYLVASVDRNNVYFHMTYLLPKYWTLVPLSHYTFIDHAVNHKILSLINTTFCLKISQKQNKVLDLAVRYAKYDKNLPHVGIIVDASHKYLRLKDLYIWIYLHNITVN